jgi:menaquinone-specific isochorismate synthase
VTDAAYLWSHQGEGVAGHGVAARIDPGTGPQRFARAAAALAETFASAATRMAFISFTFDADDPGSSVVVPEAVRPWSPGPVSATPGDRVRYAGSTLPDARWLEAVATALERIAAGEVAKVVLARDRLVWAKTPFDAGVLASRLAVRFPDCFTFVHDGLVGATPELLLRRRGRQVTSVVLAGTARRAADGREDRAAGQALLDSEKEQAEHRYAVESVRDALTRVCGALQADPAPQLLRLDNVQHLATTIRGALHEPLSALEVAGLLHPTAAVGGTPTAAAIATITELEGMERGRYAGPVGWVDAEGDGELGIALRCAELDGTGARMFAGAGVVSGSLPEAELEETRLKLLAMQSAFEGG